MKFVVVNHARIDLHLRFVLLFPIILLLMGESMQEIVEERDTKDDRRNDFFHTSTTDHCSGLNFKENHHEVITKQKQKKKRIPKKAK